MSNPPIETTGYASGISSGASSPREAPENGPKITLPTADKAPVRVDEVTSAQGRTLDELHQRDNAGTSSPSDNHYNERHKITVEDVQKPFETATRKIEAEAIESIDAFTEAFVGGLGEAREEVKQVGQTIESSFGGVIEDLRAHSERMQVRGEMFNAGLAESRIVRQRIVESMREENEGMKKWVESMDSTIKELDASNKSTAEMLLQIKKNRGD